ncbi:MAG: cytochrome c biosis protein transrane region [Verrucomicrobiales bacterium]|nr:cytochrome c biosis protein transrane region [Verrucomicrobiales bacterium]
MRLLRFMVVCGLALLPLSSAFGAAKTQVGLIVPAQTVRPGESILVGVQMRSAPKWHTYWRNPGESGAATRITWTLPTGVTAGEIQWPVPEKYESAGMVTYVYHDEVVLLVPLTFDQTLPNGPLQLSAKVSWLECEQLCVPGKATLNASLTVADATKPSPDAAIIRDAQKRLPKTDPTLTVQTIWEDGKTPQERFLTLAWKPHSAAVQGDFFPYESANLEFGGATEVRKADPNEIRVRKTVKKLDGDWPKEINGLVLEQGTAKTAEAWEMKASQETKIAEATSVPTALLETKPATQPVSLLGMLGFAFLGGLILNIMPCVLPVIALKILGFVQQSKEAPARVGKLGMIYGLGVIFSFLCLAGLVIGVQQAGHSAAWGMQFQNPRFVIAMTTLVLLIALNLFGVFEVTLSGNAIGAASQLASREGTSGAFFNGILATALATPCTAPFLATALGYAFVQPPAIIVLFFVCIGLGLAFPYVLLSLRPSWLKFLPKPGAWMEKFKIMMGFPMLATAVWLLSLTGRHFGNSGPLWIGIFLITVALAAYIYGAFVQRGVRHKGLAAGISLALLMAGYGYALERELKWRTPVKQGANPGLVRHSSGVDWQPWSKAAVDKARSEGRPVLVDFTADWCLTCQANKKIAIEIASVQAKLKEINAISLLGDYTLEDDAITAELKRFDRAGVPLVVVYPKDPKKAPLVLPATLTPSIVLDALDQASK